MALQRPSGNVTSSTWWAEVKGRKRETAHFRTMSSVRQNSLKPSTRWWKMEGKICDCCVWAVMTGVKLTHFRGVLPWRPWGLVRLIRPRPQAAPSHHAWFGLCSSSFCLMFSPLISSAASALPWSDETVGIHSRASLTVLFDFGAARVDISQWH